MKLQQIYQNDSRYDFNSLGSDRELGLQVQALLINLRLLSPPADGIIGPKTIAALLRFEKILSLPQGGALDRPLAKALIETKPDAIPEKERTACPGPFDEFMHLALQWEGTCYENVPGDYGGPTFCGVTWRDCNIWRTEHGLNSLAQPSDVRFMSMDQIRAVYREHYWDKIQADSMPRRIAIAVADFELNAGTRGVSTLQQVENQFRADNHGTKALQSCLQVAVDGVIGPTTLSVLSLEMSVPGAEDQLLRDYFQIRERCYRYWAQVPSQTQFLQGWLNRCHAVASFLGAKY